MRRMFTIGVLSIGRLRLGGAWSYDEWTSQVAVFRTNAPASEEDPLLDAYLPIVIDGESVFISRQMQALQPRIGRCYVGNPRLVDAVRLWRQREFIHAMNMLKSIVADRDSDQALKKDARHLMLNIAMLHELFQDLHDVASAALEQDSEDLPALWAMSVYHACAHRLRTVLGSTNGYMDMFLTPYDNMEDSPWWQNLSSLSPFFYDTLQGISENISASWDKFEPLGNTNLEDAVERQWPGKLVIGVFGWGPVDWNETSQQWEGRPPMMERIDTAFELSEAFPEATIIASGGAVSSGMVEGDYIYEELVARNPELESRIVIDTEARDSQGNAQFTVRYIQEHAVDGTLLIVGSDWQNPRFKAVMTGVVDALKTRVTVAAVGAGVAYLDGEDLVDRLWIEQLAIWRDRPRSLGWYEACDLVEPAAETTTEAASNGTLDFTWAGVFLMAVTAMGLLMVLCIRGADLKQDDVEGNSQLQEELASTQLAASQP